MRCTGSHGPASCYVIVSWSLHVRLVAISSTITIDSRLYRPRNYARQDLVVERAGVSHHGPYKVA